MAARSVVIAFGFSVLGLTAACSQASSPLAPVPPPPATPGTPGGQTAWAVSGTVWQHTQGGIASAPAGELFGWIQTATAGWSTGRVPVDAAGRYEFSVPGNVVWVSVKAGHRGYQQPCAARISPMGDATLDVHLVDPDLRGANLPDALADQGPTLSGVVYEDTSSGRTPLANAAVVLDGVWGLGVLLADTTTDASGRYTLCGVPAFDGMTLQALAAGFDVVEIEGPRFAGRPTFDIELRRAR